MTCPCGRPIPQARQGRAHKQPTYCSWWCLQVARGTYTQDQVEPMLPPRSGT